MRTRPHWRPTERRRDEQAARLVARGIEISDRTFEARVISAAIQALTAEGNLAGARALKSGRWRGYLRDA